MSKRMSLVDASRKREEFVKEPVPEIQTWREEPPTALPLPQGQIATAIVERQTRPDFRSATTTIQQDRKKTTFNLDAALHMKLKLASVHQRREMVEIVEEAIRLHLRQFDR